MAFGRASRTLPSTSISSFFGIVSSLAAELTLFLYLLNSLLHLIMIAKSIKWQQLTLLQPTTNYSTNFNACLENSSWLKICHPERSEGSRADLWVITRIPG